MARSSKFIQNFDLGRDLDRRLRQFEDGNRRALAGAARLATDVSQGTFQSKLSGRPTVDSRRGRPSTEGTFGSYLLWRPEKMNKHLYAMFQYQELEQAAPYWLIQEIGTGNSATILDLGRTESVRSQRGRVIKRVFTFADARGEYRPADNTRVGQDQIRNLRDVRNAPLNPRAITIQAEIPGKGYIRAGGRAGLNQYRRDLRNVMRQSFRR